MLLVLTILQTKETLMYRSFAMAVIALVLVSLPAETSLASPGGRAGKSVESVTSIAPVPVKNLAVYQTGAAGQRPDRGGDRRIAASPVQAAARE
jgi:hypothetical protein